MSYSSLPSAFRRSFGVEASLAASLFFLITLSGLGQDGGRFESLVGKQVVQKYTAPLRIESRTFYAPGFQIFKVEQVKGEWVWVVSDAAKGWMKGEEVVPYDEALQFYDEEISEGRNVQAHFRRGIVWENKGELDRAIADYSEAIRLDEKDIPSLTGRARTWKRKREYSKAIADCSKALDIKYDEAIVLKRASLWDSLKEYRNAIADYDSMILRGSKNSTAYDEKAWLLATCPESNVRDGARALEAATAASEMSNYKDPLHLDSLAAASAELGGRPRISPAPPS